MIPEHFSLANTIMRRPEGMTEQQCADIHAFRDGSQVVTAWRPTEEELVKINRGDPVWLLVVGATMPPVLVTADYPFTHIPE